LLIDLNTHVVVEASAGTGKTHAIEELVLQLLLEQEVPLEKVLLVTFTEKATGELKARLRNRLETKLRVAEPDALARDGERPSLTRRARIQGALDAFDQAPIFTIHGFCQRLLAEYAFEQGQDIRREHVSDADLVKPALREVQRRIWCQDFGAHLQQVLELAEYHGTGAESWEEKVRALATAYRRELDHVLLPAESPEIWSSTRGRTSAARCWRNSANARGHCRPAPDARLV